ncbi:16S rRNA (guanine(527)-N(7))-methyltransferase RsmG [Campylobacter sp. Cr9]|uniref:16S rRNA (guanine(527)-N(7))-methyltransferase RsmG n=1 Tax=Campylobacter sp. Cr9 TaxID=2735728 RepID=UPI0030143533|nr:16S rRNA (guanine(527)-N(7))-methyltransferase RsmG [Campylobacter sp. Cr9]
MNNEFLEFVKEFEIGIKTFNKTHNITRLKDIKAAAFDSIEILNFLEFKSGIRVADIGSGAGFPALFLAFLKRDCEFYLYEPNYKKAAFLSLMKAKFNLENVFIKPIKVECENDLKCDLITSRAFAKTEMIVTLCNNISNSNTKFILYKGSFVKDELDCLNDFRLHERNNRIFLEFHKKDFKIITN